MKQSVCTTQIDKSAEIRYILNGSFNNIAFMDSFQKFLLHFSFLSNDKLLAVADISSSLRIVLADYEFNILSCIFVQILFISIGYKACRDENSNFLHYYA